MRLIAWNVRGVNEVYKQKEVKKFIVNNEVALIAILENRVKEDNASRVTQKYATNWKWCANYAHSSKGRIWVIWDPNRLEFEATTMSSQAIHGILSIPRLHLKLHLKAVYGLHTIEARKELWEELKGVSISVQRPWQFGNPVQENEIRDYNDFIQASGMIELRAIGRKYTWSNGQIWSRIDRALVNAEWLMTAAITEVMILNPGISDHTPLSIQLKDDVHISPKPFRFLNCLADYTDFLKVVANTWCETTGKQHMHDIWWKLKAMKKELKQLNHTELRNVGERIEFYRQKLQDIQTQRGHHTQPDLLFEEEKEVKVELEKWSLVEESILKQKSRNKWLELGDENNSYFSASLRNRQAQNRITSLIDSKGDIIQQPEDIAAEVTSFYKILLGSAAAQLPAIDP
ncbi:PREDICTED: uncharacterized protein LOC109217117 [Nicotiana attenuata]|uniref:uncharacterized protein LOC109217117 n=1 Tax=Nicotiana attenuata TaxID=49451 RepID=UPI0009052E72|nr:PREDICTED: uncharacterized protein LOC109217117 [Nicotiana attenuata]